MPRFVTANVFYLSSQKSEKFTEERSKDNLLRFSMRFITTTVTQLWQGKTNSRRRSPVFVFSFPIAIIPNEQRRMARMVWCVGVAVFSQGNVFKEIDSAFASGFGWLITFCFDVGGNEQIRLFFWQPQRRHIFGFSPRLLDNSVLVQNGKPILQQ